MAGIISYGVQDCRQLKIVSVISSFDTQGHIMPLYVRLNGESLKIHNATLLPDSTFQLRLFRCEVMDQGAVKPIKLTYHVKEMMWSMPSAAY